MKNFLFASASLLLLTTLFAPAVYAQQISQSPSENTEVIGEPITPVRLVHNAYTGLFEQQGIPKYNRFLSAYENHELSVEDLVRAAIQDHRLPSSALTDRSYLSAVAVQLDFLIGFDH